VIADNRGTQRPAAHALCGDIHAHSLPVHATPSCSVTVRSLQPVPAPNGLADLRFKNGSWQCPLACISSSQVRSPLLATVLPALGPVDGPTPRICSSLALGGPPAGRKASPECPGRARPATRRAGPGRPKLRIGGRAVVEGIASRSSSAASSGESVPLELRELTRGRSPSCACGSRRRAEPSEPPREAAWPSRRSASASPVARRLPLPQVGPACAISAGTRARGLDSTSWGRAGSSEIDGSLFMEGFCPRVGGPRAAAHASA